MSNDDELDAFKFTGGRDAGVGTRVLVNRATNYSLQHTTGQSVMGGAHGRHNRAQPGLGAL